jgi:hypothetical protein
VRKSPRSPDTLCRGSIVFPCQRCHPADLPNVNIPVADLLPAWSSPGRDLHSTSRYFFSWNSRGAKSCRA